MYLYMVCVCMHVCVCLSVNVIVCGMCICMCMRCGCVCVCAYLSPLLLSLADGQLDLVELGVVVRLPGLQLVVKRDHLLKQKGIRKYKSIQCTVCSHQLLPDKLLLFILSIWKGIKGKLYMGYMKEYASDQTRILVADLS